MGHGTVALADLPLQITENNSSSTYCAKSRYDLLGIRCQKLVIYRFEL